MQDMKGEGRRRREERREEKRREDRGRAESREVRAEGRVRENDRDSSGMYFEVKKARRGG